MKRYPLHVQLFEQTMKKLWPLLSKGGPVTLTAGVKTPPPVLSSCECTLSPIATAYQ